MASSREDKKSQERKEHQLRVIYAASFLHGFGDAIAKLASPMFVYEVSG